MEALLIGCQRLSNVTIRCGDGLVSTHKIILASVSPFIREILSDIPNGDQVTVMMPDFGVRPIEDFLISWMHHPDSNNKDIDIAFGKVIKQDFYEEDLTPSDISEIYVKTEDEIEIKDSDETDYEEEPNDGQDLYEEDSSPSGITEISVKTEDVIKRRDNAETDFEEEPNNVYSDEESYSNNKSRKREIMNRRSFDDSMLPLIDQKIESLEKDVIPYPSNKREVKDNALKKRNIALQKAFREIVATGCSNRKAAAKFGLSEASIRRLLKAPEDFEINGCGNRSYLSMVLTPEEKKRIVKKAIEVSDGGLNMTLKLLKRVVDEEIDTLRINHPERKISCISPHSIYRFGHKHKLFDKCNERKASEKQYECDVCFQKYKTEKLVSDHKKVVHFAFLNTHLYSVRRKKTMTVNH